MKVILIANISADGKVLLAENPQHQAPPEAAKTYTAFLDKDLVTDIYFNTIPIVIGDGGIIGHSDELNLKFKIAETKLLTPEIAQIHFEKV
jgi:hypothetical protein